MAKNKKCVSCIAEIVCKAYEDDSRCVSFFAELAEALKPSHNSVIPKCIECDERLSFDNNINFCPCCGRKYSTSV
jgi:hypothetical protein